MPEIDRLKGPTASLPLIAPPGVLCGPIIPTLIRLALPTMVVLVRAELGWRGGDIFCQFAWNCGTGGCGTGVSRSHTYANDVKRWRRQRRCVSRGPSIRSKSPDRRGGAGLAYYCSPMRVWPCLHCSSNRRSAVPLSRDGRHRAPTLAAASGLFEHCVCRLRSAVDGSATVTGAARRRHSTFAGAAILLPLSPVFIFGWGPLPRLGVAGGGAAVVL
jgi:hypothetical protein